MWLCVVHTPFKLKVRADSHPEFFLGQESSVRLLFHAPILVELNLNSPTLYILINFFF